MPEADDCRIPLPLLETANWSASLQNHAVAVNQVIKLIASDADP
jgi:hypothetical protein